MNLIYNQGDKSLSPAILLRRAEAVNHAPEEQPKPAIEIALEKYQLAVDYYADHPNQALHKSYQTSLVLCQELKQAFLDSDEIRTAQTSTKVKRLRGMEREEEFSKIVTKRLRILENIQQLQAKLKTLKLERIALTETEKTKPH